MTVAKNWQAPLELVEWVAQHGKLPVPNFSAGGMATPADAALMMQLGAEAVFVGSGIFKSGDPAKRAKAIVMATKNYNNPEIIAGSEQGLGRTDAGPGHREDPGRRTVADPGMVMKIGVFALQGDFRCARRGIGTRRRGAGVRLRGAQWMRWTG